VPNIAGHLTIVAERQNYGRELIIAITHYHMTHVLGLYAATLVDDSHIYARGDQHHRRKIIRVSLARCQQAQHRRKFAWLSDIKVNVQLIFRSLETLVAGGNCTNKRLCGQ
jgi:hypothetical protein